MLLTNFLSLCEQSSSKSLLSFKTRFSEGSLTIENGSIIRIVGIDPATLRKVLHEELVEVSIKRVSPDFDTATRLAIRALTGDASAKSSAAEAAPAKNIVSTKSVYGKPADPFLVTGPTKAKEAKPEPKPEPKHDPKSMDGRKTMSVDSTNQVPHIMLPFMIGRPEKKIIGRGETCDIVVESYDVSRKHCEVTFCGKNLQVKDLSSSNGTFINGKPVTESTASSHDILRLGSVPFIVVIDGTS